MVAVTTFYIDDSGTRHPDRVVKLANHKHDWFALGGIMIDDEDIPRAENAIDEFCNRWPAMGTAPLHSVEIRGCHNNYAWLGIDNTTRAQFLTDLENLLLKLPVLGMGCVIDRPGYNNRYSEKYGRQKWALCKTSFGIAVERAAKQALSRDRKLRIYVETCSKTDDTAARQYYDELKANGPWFNPTTSDKYAPVRADIYKNVLYEFRIKQKSSRLMQIADMYLWPICIAGYDQKNYSYSRLMEAGKLIDCHLTPSDKQTIGIKYSCFGE